MYNLPNKYSDAYQKMVDFQVENDLEFEKYLNMTSAFNDEIYNMKYADEWGKSCEFDLGNKRLLQSDNKKRYLGEGKRILTDQ